MRVVGEGFVFVERLGVDQGVDLPRQIQKNWRSKKFW